MVPIFRRATIGWVSLQLMVAAAAAAAAAGPPVTLPGCRESCGEVSVPYPFGIGVGCFHEGFGLTCDDTQPPPKLLLLGDGAVEVLDVSLTNGTASGPFVMSIEYNWFVAMGCNIVAQLVAVGSEKNTTSICAAMCVHDM